MTLSLRSYAACIGVAPPFSTLRHFFGYNSPPPWRLNSSDPPKPSFLSDVLSLKTQMQRLDQQHFPLAVVLAGFEDGLWNADMEHHVDCALQVTREIYALAGIGIGRISRWTSLAGAPASVTNNRWKDFWATGSGSNLLEDYTVTRDAINVFYVLGLDDAGYTPFAQPEGRAGVIVKVTSSGLRMGRTTAHELGHVLIRTLGWVTDELGIPDPGFLDHIGSFWKFFFDPFGWFRSPDPSHLMTQSNDAAKVNGDLDIEHSVNLDGSQRHDIRTSKWVRQPCNLPPSEEAPAEAPGSNEPAPGSVPSG